MKTTNNRKIAAAAIAIIGGLFAVNSQAAPVQLNGSSTIGSSGASISGLDLSNPGDITVTLPFYGTNLGDFSPIPSLGIFSVGVFNLANMSSFDILGPAGTFGTYTVTHLDIISQSANFLNVFTSGLLTAGATLGTEAGGCATGGNTCAPTIASLRWSFTESGNSVSASGTFASPAIPLNIPEPAVLGLMLVGLAGWEISRRTSAKNLRA